jgi:hypothetical protein
VVAVAGELLVDVVAALIATAFFCDQFNWIVHTGGVLAVRQEITALDFGACAK